MMASGFTHNHRDSVRINRIAFTLRSKRDLVARYMLLQKQPAALEVIDLKDAMDRPAGSKLSKKFVPHVF